MPAPDIDRGTELDAWLRRLASRLVTDPATADDLAQETHLASLGEPQPPSRSWLHAVARRKLLDHLRRKHRRARHESAAAREAHTPSPAEIASLGSIAQTVRAAVDELDEPYLTVIRLRYFDDFSVAEIAQKLSRPESTIKTQLRTAITELRANLDRRSHGDRSHWLSALVVLAGRDPRERTSRATVGAVFALAWLWWSIAGVALALTIAFVVWREDAPGEEPLTRSMPASESQTEPRSELAATPAIESRSAASRDSVETATPASARDASAASAPLAPVAASALRLRLIDAEGAALEGLDVRVRSKRASWTAPLARTDANGRASVSFGLDALGATQIDELDLARAITLRFSGAEYDSPDAWVIEPPADPQAELELRLPASTRGFAGRVRDESTGTALAGARLTITPYLPLLREVQSAGRLAARVLTTPIEVESDAQGGVRVARLPDSGASWSVTAPGFLTAQGTSVDFLRARDDVEFKLGRAPRLRGTVRDEHGASIAGARVEWATRIATTPSSTRSGANGDFVLDLPEPGQVVNVTASSDETPPRLARLRLESRAGEQHWDPVLRRVTGVRIDVVNEDGTPAAGAGVRLSLHSDSRFSAANPSGWTRRRYADEHGRAEFLDIADEPMIAWIYPRVGNEHPAQRLANVVERDEPWRVELPDVEQSLALFSACFVRNGARPEPAPTAALYLPEWEYRSLLNVADGCVAPTRLPPGPCYVGAILGAQGSVDFGPFDLRPGQPFDAGELVLPALGTLDWNAGELASEPGFGWGLRCVPRNAGVLPISTVDREWGAPPRERKLVAGRYFVDLWRRGRLWTQRAITIEPGTTTVVDDDPHSARALTLRIEYATRPENGGIYVRRRIQQEFVLERREPVSSERVLVTQLVLPPGDYEIATLADMSRDVPWHPVTIPLPDGASSTLEWTH